MDNTHKLLLAFIEASGFDVESSNPRRVSCICSNRTADGCSNCGYTGFIGMTRDYKVTKKGPVNMRPEGIKITYKNGKWQ